MHECAQHGLPSFGFDHGCYTCLKVRGLAGGSLSQAEADFAGFYVPRKPEGGWHAPDLPAIDRDLDPSPEDTEFLRGLMSVGQEQLEFLA